MIEKIYDLKIEELDKIIKESIEQNKEKFKIVEKEKLEEKIKENSIKMELERLLKNMKENNNIKNEIIMKEMYKQGFKDGTNLILDIK